MKLALREVLGCNLRIFLENPSRKQGGLEMKYPPTRTDAKRLSNRNKSPLMRLTSKTYGSLGSNRDL